MIIIDKRYLDETESIDYNNPIILEKIVLIDSDYELMTKKLLDSPKAAGRIIWRSPCIKKETGILI